MIVDAQITAEDGHALADFPVDLLQHNQNVDVGLRIGVANGL